ncbi:BTAD domain-containing putative transcriptional regulator [Kitasatospora sp. NPDC058170]|uniref:BTAD domain-containing putative transcriptional regulator n=1 Tax=Kitasatospora sp. NPDC058170 TaxID=3346364 RepID=UPI0036DDF8FB
MRFEVLGPMAVRTDDGLPVPVPEAKVRALLADLLVHHGRPVPVDRLIDDLWGDALPGDPENSLQTKVSQLRRALAKAEDGARALVAYGPAGYALRVAREAVDSGRFTDLTRRAGKEPDPRMKAALLTDALGLWRGAAYADFRDADFARAAIAGLEEQRLTAQEELAELRLGFGEHAALADELGGLAAEHPLRQRLRAAQLLALYRTGRQGEALAAYRALDRRFAEELGVDPGAALSALHQAMLRQDPSLDPNPTPATPSTTLTHNAVTVTAKARSRTGVPVPASSLIGRQDAVARVCALVAESRLVTLTGPGGVGKTRLALAAAARLAEPDGPGEVAFADGVRFVELAGDRGEVAETVATALGVRDDAARERDDDTAETRLAGVLAGRRLLLVLDNCEHVIGPVAALAGRLLRRAPGLHILATSQEPLAISGEVLDAVAPLPEAAAVELFAARASAAAPGFHLGPDNREAVALICRRLDGIPLALELAATRVRALGVHTLADRLHDRFRLLNQVRRDAPARQRTLRAMIDWSWELLSPLEQTVLRRLAVFSGGFTLEDAEYICATADAPATEGPAPDTAPDAAEVLDAVIRLVDRSLVVADEDGGGTRYRMLESVAAYSLERLDEAGETGRTRTRHARHYTGLAERAAPRLHGREQRAWLRRLDRETPNLRAALDHATATGAAGLGLRLTVALTWYWQLRGRLREALRSLEGALALVSPATPGPLADAARVRLAAFTLLTGDEVPAGGFGAADARGRWLLAFARCGFDDQAAVDELLGLPAEFRALGDRWGEAAAHSVRATLAMYRGDLDGLRREAGVSAALFGELGDRWGQLQASEQLGVLAEISGDYPAAARLHRDGVRSAEELELWTHASYQLARQGRIALLTGDDAQATELHERARRLAVAQSQRSAEQFAETGLALGARRRGDLDAAERHLRPWLEWNRRLGVDSGTALVLAQLGYVAEQRGDAALAEALHLDGLSAARRTGDPRALALALEGLAGARSAAARHEQAAALLGTAAALRDSVGAPLPRAERFDVDRAAARARGALGPEGFAAAFAQGRALTAEDQAELFEPALGPR